MFLRRMYWWIKMTVEFLGEILGWKSRATCSPYTIFVGIRRKLSFFQEDGDRWAECKLVWKSTSNSKVPGILVSDRTMGISLLISLTWEQTGGPYYKIQVSRHCLQISDKKLVIFLLLCEPHNFPPHSKISVLLWNGCNLLIRVWLQMTLPHQKSARPESIHAASLHPSIQSIFQYLIPYPVACDTVVK